MIISILLIPYIFYLTNSAPASAWRIGATVLTLHLPLSVCLLHSLMAYIRFSPVSSSI